MSAQVFAADVSRTEVSALDVSGARAAPTGGARQRGRGCAASLSLIALLIAPMAQADPVETGSGVAYIYHDIIDEAPTWRLRFVVDGLGDEGLTYSDLTEDFGLLCQNYALPKLSESGADPERVVISLMSEPTDFGVMDPSVMQFFESYTIENGLCIWEAF